MNTEDAPYDLFNKVTYVNKAAIEASVTAIDKKELGESCRSYCQCGQNYILRRRWISYASNGWGV